MSHSVSSSTVVITSTTEGQIKHDLALIRVLSRRSSGSRRKLDANQEIGMEPRIHSILIEGSILYTTSREEEGTLLQISGNNRSIDSVLRKGSGGLLIRRAIGTDLIKGRSLSVLVLIVRPITIPCGNLCHTLRVRCRHLPSWDQLHPHSVDLNLIEETREIRILGNLGQDTCHLEPHATSELVFRHTDSNISAIFQAEPRNVALLLSTGKIHHGGTTCAAKTSTPVPSVGTTSRATIPTICHLGVEEDHKRSRLKSPNYSTVER